MSRSSQVPVYRHTVLRHADRRWHRSAPTAEPLHRLCETVLPEPQDAGPVRHRRRGQRQFSAALRLLALLSVLLLAQWGAAAPPHRVRLRAHQYPSPQAIASSGRPALELLSRLDPRQLSRYRFWDEPNDEESRPFEQQQAATELPEWPESEEGRSGSALPISFPERGFLSGYGQPFSGYGQPQTSHPDGQPYGRPLEPARPFAWQLMPEGLVYRSYMAGAKESRFRGVWHHDEDGGWIWDIVLGGRVGLVRYGTFDGDRPEGLQLDIEGAGQPRLDLEENSDVDAADFRFGVPLTYAIGQHQWKLAYYHLSSHLGDEFLLKNPGFTRLNYSRDAFVLGYGRYVRPDTRLYVEAGWSFHDEVAEPWEFQFGLDFIPPGRTGARGVPFFALNGHLREEVNFGGNFVVQAGWAWKRGDHTGIFRMGMEYYNGESDQFSFFDQHENKIGMGLWYDY